MTIIFLILAFICYIFCIRFMYVNTKKTYSKPAIIMACCALIFFGAAIFLEFISEVNKCQYTTTATGVNEVTIKTDDDEVVWRAFNEDIEKGKKYEVTFDTKGTNKITDDEIIEIKEIK